MKKNVRTNNSPFMNKTLSKAIMTRSRLRNKSIKNPSPKNKSNYTRYRNYCTRLIRKEKKTYNNNLDIKLITYNRKFWNTVKPLFSDKHFNGYKINLIEGKEIIFNDRDISGIFNTYFCTVVKNLDIEGFVTDDYSYVHELDYISNLLKNLKITRAS